MKHILVQDKKATGSYKSEYHCDKCGQMWGYYDLGDFKRTEEYVNIYYPCKELDE